MTAERPPARRSVQAVTAALVVVGAVTLSGCSPVEYHGPHSGIDGVLARQIASFEDPINFFDSSAQDPSRYLAELGVVRWDGSPTTLPDLSDGAIVLYDVDTNVAAAEFSVFISSGPRPDVPTDDGREYAGPSQVYTCYAITADFGSARPTMDRILFAECPAALVKLLPDDAAFASGDVFDG